MRRPRLRTRARKSMRELALGKMLHATEASAPSLETIADAASARREWPGEVGYVLMGFPRLSETFIAQEIQVLEQRGARLRLFAVKHGDSAVHDNVAAIRAPLTYLPKVTSLSGTALLPWLWRNLPAYWRAHAALARRRPLRYLATLASAVAMCWRYRDHWFALPRKVYIKEFLQAGHIAHQIFATPQVRHLHGHFCHGATNVTWFASRLTGLPFSFTAHAKDIYQADQNPGDLLPRKLKAARFATTCTDANRAHLAHHHPHCPAVHTIYHGLDTRYFSPVHRKAPAPPDLPMLLAVGRLVEKKGFHHLVDACALLRDAGQQFRCLIVGEPGEQGETLRTAIAAHRLDGVVTLHGAVKHEQLRELYARAALFVLPCLVAANGDRDGIPNVLAEAMAMGLPVVTTPVSGIPELVKDGRNGVFVKEADARSLAQAIGRLLAEPRERERLGMAARDTILEVFDARRTIVALEKLFEASLHATSPQR